MTGFIENCIGELAIKPDMSAKKPAMFQENLSRFQFIKKLSEKPAMSLFFARKAVMFHIKSIFNNLLEFFLNKIYIFK